MINSYYNSPCRKQCSICKCNITFFLLQNQVIVFILLSVFIVRRTFSMSLRVLLTPIFLEARTNSCLETLPSPFSSNDLKIFNNSENKINSFQVLTIFFVCHLNTGIQINNFLIIQFLVILLSNYLKVSGIVLFASDQCKKRLYTVRLYMK